MKRIYLVRHCKATGQQPSAELTEEGVTQSLELSDYFLNKSIELIVSSPFERAVSTIRPFANKRKLAIHIDDRLSERVLTTEDRSDWMDLLKESFDDLNEKLPGGESSKEAMFRGIEVINDLFEREEENIIVVTHGNLMALILKHFDGNFGFEEWKRLTNPDLYELQYSNMKTEIRRTR